MKAKKKKKKVVALEQVRLFTVLIYYLEDIYMYM